MSRLYDTARWAYWRVRGIPLPPLVLFDHTRAIRSVAFLPDGKQVVSGSEDRSIRAWKVEDGDEAGRVTVMKEEGVVVAVAVSSDGQWIASGGEMKTITIWNAKAHGKVVEWSGHTNWVESLAFSPDSARVVSGSLDKTVIVWSTTTGERVTDPLRGHFFGVWCAKFSSDGNRVASCDGFDLRIWDSHIGELTIPPIQAEARSLAWTPNGQQLIAGCEDGSIKCFDTSTGSLLAEWNGHTDVVRSIVVACNGRFFASGSNDKTVRLWDTTTRRQQLGPALPHDRCVGSVALSPDCRHLMSGGNDKKVRVWNLQRIVPESLLGSTSANPADVHNETDSQQVFNPPQKNSLDPCNGKDNINNERVAKKDDSKGADITLQRCPSESSSLCRFLDASAVPVGRADEMSDARYSDFFRNDSPDDLPPVDEPPRKHFSKFLHKFSRKKKDRDAETQPEPQHPGAGAEAEHPVDLQPATSLEELTATNKGKEKESNPDTAPAEHSTRTPEPRPAASASHSEHKTRSRVDRIRQAITRRRDGSAARIRDRLKVTPVAYGKLTERQVAAKYVPRKRWKGKLKKVEETSQAEAGPSTITTTSQQKDDNSNNSDSDEEVAEEDEDVEASWCRVLFYLICYCGRDPYLYD